jgi:hypothetical protein
MDRILALQGLASFHAKDDDLFDTSSNTSVCSLQSSGQGASSCSINCGKGEELDW